MTGSSRSSFDGFADVVSANESDGRVLVAHDTDVLAMAARWQCEGKSFPGVIFYHPDKFDRTGEVLRALAAAVADVGERPLRGRAHFL